LEFEGPKVVELHPKIEGQTDGVRVESANFFVWKNMTTQIGIDADKIYNEQETLLMDTKKWSRKAKKTNGLQNKLARHNCCYTDLKEPVENADTGDLTPHYAKHKHPKNPEIKHTNYKFFGELAKFRRIWVRLATKWKVSLRKGTNTMIKREVLGHMAMWNVETMTMIVVVAQLIV
jgi:hypothetical protein